MKIFNFVTSFLIVLCIIHLIMGTPLPVNGLEMFALFVISLVILVLNLECIEEKNNRKN